MNLNEHQTMSLMRVNHPDWIWNRSDTHVFLSVPGSLEPFKVVAEPGNSFSPGVGTYGVSTWVWDDAGEQLHAPESMGIGDLHWEFLEGHVPVLISSWKAGAFDVESRLFTDGDNETSDYTAFLRVRVACRETPGSGRFHLVIRSFGAAGAPVRSISLSDDRLSVSVNGHTSVLCLDVPDSFHGVGLDRDCTDVSVPLAKGESATGAKVVFDDGGWAGAALTYGLQMASGDVREFGFTFPIHPGHHILNWRGVPEAPKSLAAKEAEVTEGWRGILRSITLDLPDRRFVDAFYSQVAHEYMATVHEAVRISPVAYPMWWLRDGVYLLNALDKAGLHGFVRAGSLHIAHMDAFGGMGAEGDGPGESLWILTEHYLLTRDADYLTAIYPHIKRKAELITRMIHTDKPVKALAEFRTPQYLLDPSTDILCGPARDGLITGRMDGHFPLFWVNGFAYAGLVRAAKCAGIMGDAENAEAWETEAAALREAILRKLPEFGGNERDVTGGIWPNKALRPDDPGVGEAFERFWNGTRCPGGLHRPERLWTYFELGQAHNLMLLGMRDRMWVSLNHFLDNHAAQGLYTWSEGEGDENGSGLWQRVRGWDKIPFITPHGWTSAELLLLLRDALAHEDEGPEGDRLVIGAGVPLSWMGGSFGVDGLPTYFGKCTWRLRETMLSLVTEEEPQGGFVLALPGLTGAVAVTPGATVSAIGDGRYIVKGSGSVVIDCVFDSVPK